jgi:mannose-1-phosphate guanylyltransferase / phosphomannomutase
MIENAIVWGTALIDVPSGTVTYKTKQLRDLSRAYCYESLEGLFHRSVAIVLLLLSTPLWLLALYFALSAHPNQPIRKITLLNQQTVQERLGKVSATEFNSWEWATSIPVLRHLPRLLAVIAGKLRLIGIAPEVESVQSIFPQLYQPPPLGMFSPSYLSDIPNQAYDLDIKYAKSRSFLKDMYYLGRAAGRCLTWRAWVDR